MADKKLVQQAPDNETDRMLSVIERATLNPDVDVAKMEKLLDMQERIFDKQAEMAFHQSMVRAQTNMAPIIKDAVNDHTKSMYARLETIDRQIRPIYTTEGFSLSFGTDDSPLPDCIRITCDVAHINGHVKHYKADVPTDLLGSGGKQTKTKTHAFGSTVSYGQRYLLKLIFNLAMASEDDDGNAATPESPKKVTGFQAGQIKHLLDQCHDDVRTAFANKYGTVNNMPRQDFNGTVAFLTRCIHGGGHLPKEKDSEETGGDNERSDIGD